MAGGRRNENDEKVSNSCWAAAVRAAGYGFGEIGFVHSIRCDAGPGRHAQFEPTLTLAARTQTASFVSQLFPSLPRGFRGTIEMSSDSPIQAMALRSTSTTDRFLIAALPVESLDARRNDAVLYFPQIVDGGGFSSEIFLMNLGGTIANPRLSLLSPQGQPIKMEFIQPR